VISPSVVRLGAAAGALVLAVSSRGDVLVLAALLGVVAARPVPAVGLLAAFAASAWRWSSSDLADVAGAQAVLGPAGWVGPTSLAAAAWLAALAVLASAPLPWPDPASPAAERVAPLLTAVALGASAAVVVAGPVPGGDEWWVRWVAAVAGTLVVLGASRWRRAAHQVASDAVAVLAGAGALGLVALDGRSLADVVRAAPLVEGTVVAVAVAAVVGVAVTVPVAMERRRT
jgi:hypothetical protein